MTEDNTADILRQADALIRRTRVFVAGSSALTIEPTPPEEDLPVLTDLSLIHI